MGKAFDAQADLMIVQMDTPSGLDPSMRNLIQMILASLVPVVTYVAPATNLGAAAPMIVGSLPGLPKPEEKEKSRTKTPRPIPGRATRPQRRLVGTGTGVSRSGQSVGRRPCSCTRMAWPDCRQICPAIPTLMILLKWSRPDPAITWPC